MTISRISVKTLLPIICFAAVILQAQSPSSTIPSPSEVRALLESSMAKDQAWGAWWAANGNMRELEPQLQRNLAAHLPVRSGQDEIVLDTTMDAIIQFGTNAVPLDVLQSVYPARRHAHAQVLILLAESTQAELPIDEFMRRVVAENAVNLQGLEWLTAADYMLSHHAAGFVGAMLQDLKITGNVAICDAASNCEFLRKPAGYGGSDPWSGIDSGFPPWPTYQLVKSSPDAVVFLKGATEFTTMSYRRVLGPGHASNFRPPPTTSDRMSYVAAAAPQLRIPAFEGGSLETLKVVWRNEAAYEAELDSFKRSILGRYSAMIQQLQNTGLLGEEEAKSLAKPKLEIVVDDQRKLTPGVQF